jgi:large subunit ribosomal protein LP0
MAPRNPEKLAKKTAYLDKLKNFLRECPRVLIVSSDHVGSKQMQEIRISLRGKAHVLMGKNTMVRTALNQFQEENPDLDLSSLLEVVRGNVGFIFCISDPEEVRKIVLANKVPAAAKAGVLAQCDVTIPAGATGLDPAQTNFFQALNIATKIVKGQIELVADVPLLKAGVKVQMSEQVLLQKLKINPFSYSLVTRYIYDNGNVFDASVLDITDAVILSKITRALANVAALSREVGIPCEASAPHAINNAFKNLAAVCAVTDIEFDEVKTLKEFLADPSKFAVAAPAAASPSKKASASPKAAPKQEEEEAGDMDFDLFG